MVEPRTCLTADGCVLEAELSVAAGDAPRAGVVLCHPHPEYGGTMRSLVTSELFSALPAHGFTCLRFNFRGVERSTGEHGGGVTEPADVVAALETLTAELPDRTPAALVGWSFGADMALSVMDPRVAGWVAIAPPLRFRASYDEVGRDARPKHIVLAEQDEFRAPGEVQAEIAAWVNTTAEVVAGASHFFVGRTDRVVAATERFLGALVV